MKLVAYKVSQRRIRYYPDDNLGVGYIGTLIQKHENYQKYLKEEEESLARFH
jgi:ribosomal protein L27